MAIYIDCLYCIDGNMPAGIHGVLGPVYQPCPVCMFVCPSCEGDGIFAADYTCLPCLRQRLARLGLAAVLCGYCLGVVDLIPIDTVPEVTRDDHHH
ncbi:hypothetical protein [Plantactinospora sp. B24E8]|uniref:hypothetical protein n=1 Tax=Plantactinospora sp. B24E8 TaxID=3153567 RepID=UPI00325E4478